MMIKIEKNIKNYTWATYKKELFEGRDIAIIQKKVIKLVNLSGLFIHKQEAARIATRLNRLDINRRKDIIAAMYMHVTHRAIPANLPNYKNLKPRWGISETRNIGLFYIDKNNETRDYQRLKELGFSKLHERIKSKHFMERLKTSVRAIHRLDPKDLTGYLDQSNALGLSESLIDAAKRILEETQEEEMRYMAEDVDNEETLIYPYKLLNKVNISLKLIEQLKPYTRDRILTKLLKTENQYQEIKGDIENIVSDTPKNSTGFLIISDRRFMRLRNKWERLAELNLNYMEHITQELFKELNKKVKNEY